MKQFIIISIALLAFAGTTAHAADSDHRDRHGQRYHQQVNERHAWPARLFWWVRNHRHDSGCGHGASSPAPVDHGGSVTQVPELDASGAALALLMLAGLLALRRETQPDH